VKRQGLTGMTSILHEKVSSLVQPPIDYARLAPSAVSRLSRHGRPDMLINAIGAGIGDDLLLTAVFRELRQRGHHNYWVTNERPQLYLHNEDAPIVVPPRARLDRLLRLLGAKVVYPWYTNYNPAYDRDEPVPRQHLISVMCQKAGITGPIALRPYLTLTDSERNRAGWSRGRSSSRARA
jgi:hypothetical protein